MLVVVGWAERYEKADTRKCRNMTWVPVPNRWDSRAYIAITKLPDAAAILGAWMAILETASRCPERGVLAEDGHPLAAEDIADKTRLPVKAIRRAIEVLTDESIGWLHDTCASHPEDSGCRPEGSGDCPEGSGNHPDYRTGQDRTGQDKTDRGGGHFVPPTVAEVEAHIREKGYSFSAEAFCAFYESKGWKIGAQPMKSWPAACVTWQNRRQDGSRSSTATHGRPSSVYEAVALKGGD